MPVQELGDKSGEAGLFLGGYGIYYASVYSIMLVGTSIKSNFN